MTPPEISTIGILRVFSDDFSWRVAYNPVGGFPPKSLSIRIASGNSFCAASTPVGKRSGALDDLVSLFRESPANEIPHIRFIVNY